MILSMKRKLLALLLISHPPGDKAGLLGILYLAT